MEQENGNLVISEAMEQRPVFFVVSISVCKQEFLSLMKLDDLLLCSQEPWLGSRV